ncbi:MAG TPA: hypothetical protein VGI17_05730 [Solirubrobacterales bacterium]
MAIGVGVLAVLCCLLPAGAAAAGDSNQSVAVTLDLCPGSGPMACAGLHVFVDSASNHYRPSEKYSYCTKDETSTDFAPKYNGEVLHVQMVAKGGFATSCQAPVASRNVWIVEAYRNNKLVERGSFWLGQNSGFGTSYHAACGKDAPLNPAFDNMTCDQSGPFNLTLSAPGWKPTYPDCPDSSDQYCAIRLHVDAVKPCLSLPISSFTSPFGLCLGKSDGTRNWTVPIEAVDRLFFAAFGWVDYQNQKWSAYVMSQGLARIALVAGAVPSSGSDQFQVKYARLWPLDPDPLSYMASGNSGPPGSPGGPLLFDFESGRVGADVYMQGFLQGKRLPPTAEVLDRFPELVQGIPELAEEPPEQAQSELQSLIEAIPAIPDDEPPGSQ